MSETNHKPVIRVSNLVKRFGERTVLQGVDLEVYPGEIMVILGGSGCGKSTLLRHMIGLEWPDEGRVELFGKDLSELKQSELDETRKRFGVLFQSGALFNSMTVEENVASPMREHTDLDEVTIDIMVRMKLEQVGLRPARDLMPSEISGGMKKRIGLARAIALDPEILFYDEPSAGLDPVTLAMIDELIVDLTKKMGCTSVVVTHEMSSAFRIADRMALIDKGRFLRIGPREEFEKIRDGEHSGDAEYNLIRQFLRGDSVGPITDRRAQGDYTEEILTAGREEPRPSWLV
ncbi:MAG: ABC transporter ATP-binding protein [Phycisphaerae bacterium]